MTKYKETPTRRRRVKNIFSDRSSLVLRALLREPEKKWTLPDLTEEGVSIGLASDVLSKAEAQGYVERVLKGPDSYTRLIREDALLKDWVKVYSFEQNDHEFYLSTDKDFSKTCAQYLRRKKKAFAFTLYSASRMISPYVKDDRHFIYVDVGRDEFPHFLKEAQTELNLYKLVQGGNVCFIVPFYRSSAFKDSRMVKSFPLVSNLQLYLDLRTFPPTGAEEAEHLMTHFKKKGETFA